MNDHSIWRNSCIRLEPCAPRGQLEQRPAELAFRPAQQQQAGKSQQQVDRFFKSYPPKSGTDCDHLPPSLYCPSDTLTNAQAQAAAIKECIDSGAKDCKPLHEVCYDNGCNYLVYGY